MYACGPLARNAARNPGERRCPGSPGRAVVVGRRVPATHAVRSSRGGKGCVTPLPVPRRLSGPDLLSPGSSESQRLGAGRRLRGPGAGARTPDAVDLRNAKCEKN